VAIEESSSRSAPSAAAALLRDPEHVPDVRLPSIYDIELSIDPAVSELLVGDREPSEAETLIAAEALLASFRQGWLMRGALRGGRR
jgi:hypothetical protein